MRSEKADCCINGARVRFSHLVGGVEFTGPGGPTFDFDICGLHGAGNLMLCSILNKTFIGVNMLFMWGFEVESFQLKTQVLGILLLSTFKIYDPL